MDLSNLKPTDEAVKMDVLHPVTRKPLGTTEKPVQILLVGKDSGTFREAQRQIVDKRLADASRRAAVSMTSEESEQTGLALLAKCTKGWEGIDWDGKPLTFSVGNAVMIYGALPWLKEQVDSFVGDRAAFLKA